MGKSCCVPNCTSNYGKSRYISVFEFPKDPDRRTKWLNCIGREKTFKITKNTVVCIKHFEEKFLILSDEFKTRSGIITIPRERPKLTYDAYPTILSTAPYRYRHPCRTEVPAKKKKIPFDRQEENSDAQLPEDNASIKNFQNFQEEISDAQLLEANDTIKNFQKFQEEIQTKYSQSLIVKCFENYLLLSKMEDSDFFSTPSLTTVKISAKFDVKIFKDNDELHVKKLRFYLGNELKCERWSKFESLISFITSSDPDEREQFEKIECLADKVNDVINLDEEEEDPEAEKLSVKIKFLVEQLRLAVSPVVKYSPDVIVWAAYLSHTYPGAYKALRDTNHLTLPHPKYLQNFLCKVGNDGPGIGPSQAAFLKENFKLLTENDKVVTLLLDEIHVNSNLSYKDGKVNGIAERVQNSLGLTAGTMQSFMSGSMRSENKEVIALFPVRSLDSEMLKDMTLAVLKLMHEVGFTVLCLIAANNKLNIKMYEILCGGELKTWIPHPFDPSKPLFLLFDQMHLFKNARNDWFNAVDQILKIPNLPQLFDMSLYNSDLIVCNNSGRVNHRKKNRRNTSKTPAECVEVVLVESAEGAVFHSAPASFATVSVAAPVSEFARAPSEDTDGSEVEWIEARFSDLKTSFLAEINSVVKLAPKLSAKAINPSSVDRQNLALVTPIFHDTTIVGLQTAKDENGADISQGTILFLHIWSTWWKICNVKLPLRGCSLNDIWRNPVMSSKDIKIKFLENLVFFLELWSLSEEEGKFADETNSAFVHTIKATIELCHYVFGTLEWRYILLGVLQTDDLDGRFGGHQQLSGLDYHFSVEQILESGRKLKLSSVLKLRSARTGEFSLATFAADSAEVGEVADDFEIFESAVFETTRIVLSLNERQVLLCLASYVATKTIQQFKQENREICENCKSNLTTDVPLEIECSDNIFDYLSGLDRESFNRPADLTVDLCVNVFKLFQTLISPKYEEPFLKLHNHRRVIIELGLSMYGKILEDLFSSCDTCSLCLEEILEKCLGILANILMSNYTMNEVNSAQLIP